MSFDKQKMGPLSVNLNRFFPTSPKKIYEAWTNSQHLSKWFGYKVEADPRIGGKIEIFFPEETDATQGEYLELIPFSDIAFTWSTQIPCENSTKTVRNTLVTIKLIEEGNGTRMYLKHDGFLDVDSQMSHLEGWSQYLDIWAVNADESTANALRCGICDTFSKSKSELFGFFTDTWAMNQPGGLNVDRETHANSNAKLHVGSEHKLALSSNIFAQVRVLELIPDEFVKFDWVETDEKGNILEKTVVRVRVADWPTGKTYLCVVQSGFSSASSKKERSDFWVKTFDAWQK